MIITSEINSDPIQQSHMAEGRETSGLHHMDEDVQDMNVTLPRLSVTNGGGGVGDEDDGGGGGEGAVVFISPLTTSLNSFPDLVPEFWIDTESGEDREVFPVKAPDILGKDEFLTGYQQRPEEVTQKDKVNVNDCLECGKMFKTTSALKKHLFTHRNDRPHVCHICQRGFKLHDHLMAHIVTHKKKKKPYHCTQPGCNKAYCDHSSLKCHCATQHGVCTPVINHLKPPSPVPSSSALWELLGPTCTTGGQSASPSNVYNLVASSGPASGSQLEGYSICPGYTSLPGNTGVGIFPERHNLTKIDAIPEPWSLETINGMYDVDELVLPTSIPVLTPDSWAPHFDPTLLSGVEEIPAPQSLTLTSVDVHSWEHNLDIAVTSLEAWREVLSGCQSKDAASPEMECPLRSACPEQGRRNNMECAKPRNKQQVPDVDTAAPALLYKKSCLPSPKATRSKKKRVNHKKSLAPTPPPLPAPRPTSRRRSGLKSTHLISLSQAAMVSFIKKSSPSLAFKGRDAAMIREGRERSDRICLHSQLGRAQTWPSLPQSSTAFTAEVDHHTESLTPDGKLESPAGRSLMSQELQLSPPVIPVSVPVSHKEERFNNLLVDNTHTEKVRDLSRNTPNHLTTLVIPSLFDSGSLGLHGHQSHLRSPTCFNDKKQSGLQGHPYTPPPMLSPVWPGTGLYCSALLQDGKDGISSTTDNVLVKIEPRINVGCRFQADIPPLRNPLLMLYDEHPAQLLWAPWGDLPTNLMTQRKVQVFLDMCCSSVMPGGGTNTELALHCLHEVQGDAVAALDLLLLREDYWTPSHPLSNYHYTGTDHWSVQEIKRFWKALVNHNKDFHQIHNLLQTKSVAQCVEYYYTMKKQKTSKMLESEADVTNGTFDHSTTGQRYKKNPANTRPLNTRCNVGDGKYVCRVCGRAFFALKSRNAHMKIHR